MNPEEFYLSNWWLLLVIICVLLLVGVGVFYVILRFPGIIDWKFIKQNFEDRVQDPVKKFSSSLYGHLILAGGEVVRKISVRNRNYSGGAETGRRRKKGICEVNFNPNVENIEDGDKVEDIESGNS